MAERAWNGTAFDLTGSEAAPLVVLIHGLGLNRKTWQWHGAALAARYRVLTYDLFGHGESPPPPETPSLSVFARQLLDLLDELDIERAALVGFSLGGMINRRFALDHPERVSALAILNSPHERGPEAQRLVEERAARSSEGPAATLEATIERWFTPGFREAEPAVIETVRQWVLANEPRVYGLCRQVLAKGVVELIRPDPPIEAPALVMTAENDSGSTPAMSQAIAAEIEGAETVILPGLQHMGLVERPALFTGPILRFLDKTLGSR